MMVVAIVAWHLVLLVFARTESTPFAMLVLAGYGLSMSVAMVTMSIMLLSRTPQEFRGRVMGVRSLAVYGLPMGLLGRRLSFRTAWRSGHADHQLDSGSRVDSGDRCYLAGDNQRPTSRVAS